MVPVQALLLERSYASPAGLGAAEGYVTAES
jgi:hypothetical protein